MTTVALPGTVDTEPVGVSLIACHDCGLLQRVRPLPDGGAARCGRCNAVLYKQKHNSIERTLTLTIAALILFVLANVFPFMTFKLEGRAQTSNLSSGAVDLYADGLWELAILVLLVAIVIPLLKLLGTLYVLFPLHLGRRSPYVAAVFRFVETLHPWAMVEVYLLGVIVAYAKLIDLATIELGVALYSFVALIFVMIAADAALEPRVVWERLGGFSVRHMPTSAERRSLIGCHACNLVSRGRPLPRGAHPVCPRCGAALHRRKPNSLNRTWALVITAAILYIPANVYPVMTVVSFDKGEPNTILGGIKELIAANMWPLALLVFFASITVPMLKLIGLTYLMVSVQRGSASRLRDRTVLYRVIEAVGRWSMIDIFMISILVALVRLGSIATIEPGIGAISFAGVVVITMFAAMTFDPRLMWDAAEANVRP